MSSGIVTSLLTSKLNRVGLDPNRYNDDQNKNSHVKSAIVLLTWRRGKKAYLERNTGISMVQKRQYSKYKQNDHKLSHIFIGSS